MPPVPSQLDKYETQKVLGQGSYGKALLVRLKTSPSGSPQYFVMKEIQIGHLSRKEKEASIAEATVLDKMHHSNICAYKESFFNVPSNPTVLYIVMDFADGGDLSAAITRRKKARNPFAESEVMSIFVQVCLALKHVHNNKILHRDLKSQNIFLTKKGVVKLGDFGIAKVLDSTEGYARTQIGTPYYLSPEICEDRAYGKKSDVWSLGCVLYEVAALDLPFQAKNLPALAHKIMTATPAPIPLSHGYSPDLQRAVTSLLNKKPELRPSVAAVLRTEYVRSHISSLLSHTIKAGTGGMESDARQAAAAPPPSSQQRLSTPPPPSAPGHPSPRLSPPTVGAAANANHQPQPRSKNMLPLPTAPPVGPSAAAGLQQQQALQREALAQREALILREVAQLKAGRLAKEEEARQQAAAAEERQRQRAVLQRQQEEERRAAEKVAESKRVAAAAKKAAEEAALARERREREREREKDAMRRIKEEGMRRRQEAGANAGSFPEWVGVGDLPPSNFAAAPAVAKDAVYDGRDGWMYKDQLALEAEISEAKRIYEREVTAREANAAMAGPPRPLGEMPAAAGAKGAWQARREAAAVALRKDDYEVQQRAAAQGNVRRSFEGPGGPGFNNGQFADPTSEWEWRRQQAEKNRIRAESDLGRGKGQSVPGDAPPSSKVSGSEHSAYDEISELRARLQEAEAREARENARKAVEDQNREIYFKNREIAAQAKKRYDYDQFSSAPSSGEGSPRVGVQKRASAVDEVRRSVEVKKSVEELKRIKDFEDAFRANQIERKMLQEKLKQREREQAAGAAFVADHSEAKEVEDDVSKNEYPGEVAPVVDEEDDADNEAEVFALAQALNNEANGGEVDEDEEEDEDDTMIEGGHNTLTKVDPTSLINTMIEASDDADFSAEPDEVAEAKAEFKASEKIRNMISPVKKRAESKNGSDDDAKHSDDGSEEKAVDEVDYTNNINDSPDLIADLMRESHRRIDAGSVDDDDDDDDDDIQVGGGQHVLMPPRMIQVDLDGPMGIASPPPVVMEIDLFSPGQNAAKKSEAFRLKQEQRAREREDARRKAREEERVKMDKMKQQVEESAAVASAASNAAGLKKKKWETGDANKIQVVSALRGGAGAGGAGGAPGRNAAVAQVPSPGPANTPHSNASVYAKKYTQQQQMVGAGNNAAGMVPKRASAPPTVSNNGEGINTLVSKLEKMKEQMAGMGNGVAGNGVGRFALHRDSSAPEIAGQRLVGAAAIERKVSTPNLERAVGAPAGGFQESFIRRAKERRGEIKSDYNDEEETNSKVVAENNPFKKVL